MEKFFIYAISVILLMAGLILLAKPKLVSDTTGRGVTIPTSVLLIFLGLLAAVYPTSSYYKPTPEPAPTVLLTPTPTAAPASIAITSPANDAGVGSHFTVSGTAPDLNKDKLWLFVSGENTTTQGDIYYRTSNSPLDITGGIWNAKLGELDTPGKDIGHLFTLVLVRANPTCSNAIATNQGIKISTRQLPPGCSEVPPPLIVKKER